MAKIVLFSILSISYSYSQDPKWLVSTHYGKSGLNTFITGNSEISPIYQFNQKINILDNKLSNVCRKSYGIAVERVIAGKEGIRLGLKLGVKNFESTYFKEDKFYVTFEGQINDTINSPNWLVAKYTFPQLEVYISKELLKWRNHKIQCSAFIGYTVEVVFTSKVTLYDSVQDQFAHNLYVFNKDDPNEEYDSFDFGLILSAELFTHNAIYPFFMFQQGLNDISRHSFKSAQHANLWAAMVGLKLGIHKKLEDKRK